MTSISSNKIIQSFCFGKNLSKLEQLSISSYLANGHEFHLYCYDEIQGLPNGTTIKDANSIIEKKDLFVDPQGSVAPFADWFRCNLLYKQGGWWVDLDSVCLKPFDTFLMITVSRQRMTLCKKYIYDKQYLYKGS